MTIKPIRTHDDYENAIAEIERRFAKLESTREEDDELEVLAVLVEAYEAKHYPCDAPHPIAAIEYEMEKRGLTRRDLEPIIGPSGRVSEIMNRQRPLTMNMIRNLHKAFGLPADVLVAPYPLARRADIADKKATATV